ncbi:MAG: O-antigen ligase family protein [Candidatus Sulfotelmatobacter sp.]
MQSGQTTEPAGVAAAHHRYAGDVRHVEESEHSQGKKALLSGAFFWLTVFYFVYCGRPADLIPALGIVPLAKIAGALATLSLLLSIGRTPRRLKDLPKEGLYLLLLIVLMFVSALLSPVWKGGAFFITLEFSKVVVVWVLTFLLVTTLGRLRRIIFLQAGSVALISVIAIAKGRSVPRLEGVIGGFYSNPNDMAFAIVLCIPFCLAFLLSARGLLRKALWSVGIVAMAVALMLTASRAGFIDLLIAGTVLLWQFGVKGKRPYLIVGAVLLMAGLFLVSGKELALRFNGIFNSGDTQEQDTAHQSYEERRILMDKAVEAIVHYPILGVGAGDFVVYSGMWTDVHASYLQIAADGGIPILILYLLFFARGFANLRALGNTKDLDGETVLLVGALKSSLVGFVVGACFAPEAYQYFPYFTVCYTSVLLAMVKEREPARAAATRLSISPLRNAARAY